MKNKNNKVLKIQLKRVNKIILVSEDLITLEEAKTKNYIVNCKILNFEKDYHFIWTKTDLETTDINDLETTTLGYVLSDGKLLWWVSEAYYKDNYKIDKYHWYEKLYDLIKLMF